MALNDILKAQLDRRALLKSSLVGGGTALAGSLFGGLISNPAWAPTRPQSMRLQS